MMQRRGWAMEDQVDVIVQMEGAPGWIREMTTLANHKTVSTPNTGNTESSWMACVAMTWRHRNFVATSTEMVATNTRSAEDKENNPGVTGLKNSVTTG